MYTFKSGFTCLYVNKTIFFVSVLITELIRKIFACEFPIASVFISIFVSSLRMSQENYLKQPEGSESVVLSTIFQLKVPGEYSEKYHYSRYGNPTRNSLETSLATLEKAKHALTYSSKIAASLAITSALASGDLIIFSDILTYEKFKNLEARLNVQFHAFHDLENFEVNLKPCTKMVWIETPTNVLNMTLDIKGLTDIVHAKCEALVVVDNTLLTPHFQRPLELGADVVLYSLDEFIGGHSDADMGAVLTNDENLYTKLKYYQVSSGAVPSPFSCFIINRSLKTLSIRMEQHAKNSFSVAKFLEEHPKVEKVFHPALQSHGNSGIVSFCIKGSSDQTKNFLKFLKYILISDKLGGTDTSASYPWVMSHSELQEDQRIAVGVTKNLITLTIGLEDCQKITSDLELAFEKI